jgi:hypothetical protein
MFEVLVSFRVDFQGVRVPIDFNGSRLRYRVEETQPRPFVSHWPSDLSLSLSLFVFQRFGPPQYSFDRFGNPNVFQNYRANGQDLEADLLAVDVEVLKRILGRVGHVPS